MLPAFAQGNPIPEFSRLKGTYMLFDSISRFLFKQKSSELSEEGSHTALMWKANDLLVTDLKPELNVLNAGLMLQAYFKLKH